MSHDVGKPAIIIALYPGKVSINVDDLRLLKW